MGWVIFFFGIIWLIEGTISLIWSRNFKELVNASLLQVPVKGTGIILSIIGLLIVYASRAAYWRMPLVITGSVIFTFGIMVLFLSERFVRKILIWWTRHMSLWFYRTWGIVLLCLGSLFLWCR